MMALRSRCPQPPSHLVHEGFGLQPARRLGHLLGHHGAVERRHCCGQFSHGLFQLVHTPIYGTPAP
mgnify:CR=1 FL=1